MPYIDTVDMTLYDREDTTDMTSWNGQYCLILKPKTYGWYQYWISNHGKNLLIPCIYDMLTKRDIESPSLNKGNPLDYSFTFMDL